MTQLLETRRPIDRGSQRVSSEIMQPGDPYLNYCLWPYEAPADGYGKLRPVALLDAMLPELPHGAWVRDTLAMIRRGLGDFRTVYGLKRIDGGWAIELYLYDYARQERVVSVQRLQESVGDWLQFPDVDPRIPYFMFSFDLTEQAAASAGRLDAVHIYIGNPGSDVSSGIAYEFTRSGRQLENFYFFFDGHQHRREIVDKLSCSALHEDPQQIVDALYRAELRDCQTVCLANKRTCDTIYFSGVRIDQLLFFLEWQAYPARFVQFIREQRYRLDHLLYDVGVDYRAVNGRLEILKHGVYGVL
jgi:hypothetical protein